MKKHVSNKIVNIKRGLMELSGPFPHFLHSKQWFHQDKSLKSVITLIFFFFLNKKAWVGRERNSQKKPEKGKKIRKAHLIHLQ